MRAFIAGLVLGAVFMLIATYQSAVVTLQRIGMCLVVMAAAAGFLWGICVIADQAVRTAGLYSELIRFAWDRRQKKRRKAAGITDGDDE